MIVPGMLVCNSSVCFIVSKAFLISSATVIVRAGGAIWLNPFATVLFTVCSAVTVEFVFDSVYVDVRYDEIYPTSYCWVCVLVLCLWGCRGTLCGCGGCCNCDCVYCCLCYICAC